MAKKQKLNTIIFDVGNVLVDFAWESYLDSFGFSPEIREAVAAAVFLSPQWDEMDKSLKPDQEYLHAFMENAPQYQEQIKRVWENCADCIHMYDYALDFVKKCKKAGCRTYILSNYSRYVFSKTKHKMPFRKYMDGELFSFQIGQIKPGLEIYQSLLEKYAIDPRYALFLDDRRENLEAAAQCRIHTLQFTTYPEVLTVLENMGVL